MSRQQLPEINIQKVFTLFEKHYVLVPLEVFGSDPYKTLISTVLSARTNDDTTLARSLALFEKAPDIHTLSKLTEKQISKLIFPVGFYKTKAKHLKELSKIIVKEHQGLVPDTLEVLVKLPGVGRKTANLVMNRAFGKPAIAVDTHVHRISNMLRWIRTDSPKDTERILTEIIPEKYWTDMNRLFVSMGRQHRSVPKLQSFLEKNGLIK